MFEAEIRFPIFNIKEFREKLQKRGGYEFNPYREIDHYYKPKNDCWNLDHKNMRIRQWFLPEQSCQIYLSRTDYFIADGFTFKRSFYPEGKIKLHEGDYEKCQEIVRDLGFEPWFDLEKKSGIAWRIEKADFEFAIEEIERLGFYGEIEIQGDNPKEVRKKMIERLIFLEIIKREEDILNFQEKLFSSKPISLIYQENI